MAKTPNEPRSERFIEYALRATKGRVRVVELASSGLVILSVAILLLLGAVLADHWLPGGMSGGVRMAFRWGLLAVVAVMFSLMILRPLVKRVSDLYVARVIEKAHPEFRNDLTASLQLSADGKAPRGTVEAVRRHAAGEIASSDVQASVKLRPLRLAGICFGVGAGLFLFYWVASPKSVGQSLRRTFGNDGLAAPTSTQIVDVSPEDGTVVLTGREVRFSTRVRHVDGPVTLRLSRDGGRTYLAEDTIVMTEEDAIADQADFTARWAAQSVGGVALFRVECGDARARQRKLIVLPPPTVRRVGVTLHWPAYTGRGDEPVEGTGDVRALRGTKVTVDAECNLPVATASIVFSGRPDAAAILAVDGNKMRGDFTVEGDDRYRIVFRGTHRMVAGESMGYEIKTIADAPPRVRLTEPLRSVELAEGEFLRLAGEAEDDFGVRSLELICRDVDGIRRLPLGQYGPPGAAVGPIEAALARERIGRAGRKVTCHVEAKDYRPPDGQVGRSETFEVLIKEPDPALAGQKQRPDGSQDESLGREGKDAPGEQIASADKTPAQELLDMIRKDAEPLDAVREHFDPQQPGEQQPGQPGEQQPGEQQAGQPGEQQPGEQQAGQPGEQKPGEQQAGQPGEQQPGEQQAGQPGEQQTGEQQAGQPGEQKPGEQQAGQPGEQKPGEQQAGQPGEQKPGEQQAGQPGEPQPGEQQAGQPGEQQPGEQQAGQPGEQQPGEQQAGQPGEQKPGEQQAGQPGEQQPGEQQAGQPGEQQPGEQQAGQPGEQPPGGEQPGGQQPGQPQAGASTATPENPQPGAQPGPGMGGNPETPSTPGVTPGQAPGGGQAAPGQTPGQMPGQGQAPGQAPGPGQTPGQSPGQTPGQSQQAGGTQAARGIHSAEGSGDANSGSADQRGEVDLPKGWQELPPAEQERLRSIGRAISEASKDLRAGEVDPALLKKIGMTEGEFVAFVEKYRDVFGESTDMPGRTERPTDVVRGGFTLPGSGRLQAGKGTAKDIEGGTGTEKLTPDGLRKLYESRAAKVSPEYRKQVEAYFRAISEAAGRAETPAPTTQPSK